MRAYFLNDSPHAEYRLPKAVRQSISPYLDAEAVQELMTWVRPEHRTEMLEVQIEIAELVRTQKVAFGLPLETTGNPRVDTLLRRILRLDPPTPDS